ncbi:MAG: hypothetical protein V1676_01790 [Candidatus Diapherotrites archaeon]
MAGLRSKPREKFKPLALAHKENLEARNRGCIALKTASGQIREIPLENAQGSLNGVYELGGRLFTIRRWTSHTLIVYELEGGVEKKSVGQFEPEMHHREIYRKFRGELGQRGLGSRILLKLQMPNWAAQMGKLGAKGTRTIYGHTLKTAKRGTGKFFEKIGMKYKGKGRNGMKKYSGTIKGRHYDNLRKWQKIEVIGKDGREKIYYIEIPRKAGKKKAGAN